MLQEDRSRGIGGAEVVRQQLRHLVRQAALPKVCFQVLPVAAGVHQGLNGPFSVLRFAEPAEPTVAYVENSVSATHVRKEAEVRGYQLAFDRLRSKALSPHDSVALVERLAADM